ncbi:MAG: alpha-L-fucosidase [Halanaerobiales bacterium]
MTISEETWKRVKWWQEARFGMFIHWGLYAIPARGEWVRSQEKISVEEYQQYFEEFNPERYDPREWAKAARKGGMKYVVMTAKHHDGFCLFNSELTDYKATNTPAGRDLIKEYVEAFREEGLKVGFYYSLVDWHHPDYPAYNDSFHPMRGNEDYKEKEKDKNFSNYIEYLHGQVRELLSNYGKIDVIWFDFSYDDMTGEKWQATKLVKMVRELQPDIIIDNRLGGDLKAEEPEIFAGDFASPEQIIPAGGVVDNEGETVPWEACITLNNNWGYAAFDNDYKTPEQVIRALVECVSKGGNLLLNVGPDALGKIPEESLNIISEVGKWLDNNGDSIYGCGIAELPKPEWGRYTKKGDKLYAHVLDRGIGPINIPGMSSKLGKARLLKDKSEIPCNNPWYAEKYPDDLLIGLSGSGLPDERDTVIVLDYI